MSTSLKGPAEDIFTSPPALWPSQPSLQAYGRLFSENPLGLYLRNSAIVSALAVVANLLFCSLAAYPLARPALRRPRPRAGPGGGHDPDPLPGGDDPALPADGAVGLRNTLWALILPQAATAFGIFLLRQSFLGVPVELEEAARIDGCTPLGSGGT